jgi:hypothetical protein
MADYNIYLTSVGNDGQGNSSPTTPWQLRGGAGGSGGDSGDNMGGGFDPSNAVRRGAAFLQNPDSMIGSVLRTPIGKLGIASVIIGAAINITDKAVTMYQSYSSSASGNYKYQIEYSNFKQNLHNFMHPFSNEVQRQMSALQIKKENLANEQERLLLGGSVLNAPYGRYL